MVVNSSYIHPNLETAGTMKKDRSPQKALDLCRMYWVSYCCHNNSPYMSDLMQHKYLLSHSSGSQSLKKCLIRLKSSYRQSYFSILESLGDNLFSCIFQLSRGCSHSLACFFHFQSHKRPGEYFSIALFWHPFSSASLFLI